MDVSADTYIIISLMFAVFAAIAAVGTSIVLGAGYERLRAGFEVVRKQTGFFADAIHKLDERTKVMHAQTGELKGFVSDLSQKVERVDAQSSFFVDSLQSLERKVDDMPHLLASNPEPAQAVKVNDMAMDISDHDNAGEDDVFADISFEKEHADENVQNMEAPEQAMNIHQMKSVAANEDVIETPLSKLLTSYFRGGSTRPQSVVYH